MMSLEKFAERCGGLIKQKVPFIAYRHDRGCGVLLLDGGERTEYTVKYAERDSSGGTKWRTKKTTETREVESLREFAAGRVIGTRMVHKEPAKATVTGFRRAIAKMQRDPHTRWSLCTVEYDGSSYCIEGDNLLAMIRDMGL